MNDQTTTITDRSSTDYLAALRHSCAHVMAQAVKDLFPNTQITIGPVIQDGFYYDFDTEHAFTQEDLPKIEKRMLEIAQGNHDFVGKEVSAEESRAFWKERGETYKLELLNDLKVEAVTHYSHGDFTDLCRGGHLQNTRDIRYFKLMSVAGAYWRGDEKRPMLQRIYGTAWPDKKQLKAYLKRLEEAKKRDHRKLGADLEIFMHSEAIGPGLPIWLPRGAMIRSILERYIVDLERSLGYDHVCTPQLARTELYKQSGHWDHFKDNMYPPIRFADKEELVLRPMNCPHHIQVFKHNLHSYRDLPVRIAELGTMYRYERSGVLSGLSRVRAMTLNDAHIFCLPEQIQQETVGVLRLIERVYKDFGLTGHWYRLSLRNPDDKVSFVDNDNLWNEAEPCLRRALEEVGVPYEEATGEAAYYGPKIDVQLNDVMGHGETISTVQLDFYLPERFGLEYVGEDAKRRSPVMIHRGVISTMERMVAFLIEHYAGRFPLWLAPVQVHILTVSNEQDAAAQSLAARLREAGIRVETDLRYEKLGKKIRESTLHKIPYQIILGAKDVAAGTLSLRYMKKGAEGQLEAKQLSELRAEELVRRLREEIENKKTGPVFECED
ncbi:MAG: threonine--tRNA ligase [Elusimicrobiota bacterium]